MSGTEKLLKRVGGGVGYTYPVLNCLCHIANMAGQQPRTQLTEGTLDLTMNSDTEAQPDLNILCFEFLEMQEGVVVHAGIVVEGRQVRSWENSVAVG